MSGFIPGETRDDIPKPVDVGGFWYLKLGHELLTYTANNEIIQFESEKAAWAYAKKYFKGKSGIKAKWMPRLRTN
ncbi:MAG TPA: hypothetical protein VFR24_27765 [Candidatus Angelobacter sp.]|nr:hypothetical protein [Candidatus Angelobacter sp.]